MDEQSRVAVETTIMGIREVLMDYYKGTCVKRMTRVPALRLRETPEHFENQPRRAIRLERAYKQPRFLMWHDVPLMTVTKEPDVIIMHDNVLDRSPELSAVRTGVIDCMQRYFPMIEITDEDSPYYQESESHDDNALIRQSTVMDDRQSPQDEMQEYILSRMTAQMEALRGNGQVLTTSSYGDVSWESVTTLNVPFGRGINF